VRHIEASKILPDHLCRYAGCQILKYVDYILYAVWFTYFCTHP